MITLYGVYRSRASRPLWLLGELGQPFTHVPVIQAYRLPDPKAADAPLNTASPEYLAVHPLGQIPCLTEGDLTLTESLAMTLYIARRDGNLGPKDDAEQALMINWSLFAATAIEDHALKIQQTMTGAAPHMPEAQTIVAAAAQTLRRALARLETHLAANPYLIGSRFTVADINVAECVRYAQAHPTLLTEFPAVKAWLEKCPARPAFKAMCEKRLAEPA